MQTYFLFPMPDIEANSLSWISPSYSSLLSQSNDMYHHVSPEAFGLYGRQPGLKAQDIHGSDRWPYLSGWKSRYEERLSPKVNPEPKAYFQGNSSSIVGKPLTRIKTSNRVTVEVRTIRIWGKPGNLRNNGWPNHWEGQLSQWDSDSSGNWLDARSRTLGTGITEIRIAGIVSRNYC